MKKSELRQLIREEVGKLNEKSISTGQQVVTGNLNKLNDKVKFLKRQFPNWKFDVLSDYRIKTPDSYTLSYGSSDATDGEFDKVDKLIDKLFK